VLVDELFWRERLRTYEVMAASGLARNTIEQLRRGRTRRPSRETLSALARGLATDPRTGELDGPKMNEIHRLLDAAAGYADPSADDARSLIELGIYHRLKSLERARHYADLIEAEARELEGQNGE
jgi:transcriptional regulator with XRE-family HTH domain